MNLKKFRSTFDRHVFYNAGFSEAIEHNENWVDNLPVVASWLVSQAMALEVVDEASFSESEKKLDTRSRRDFWIARYVASCEDSWCLLDNLSSLPEWLRDSNLSDLKLTVRQSNVFRNYSIVKVSDFDQFGLDGLMNLERLGASSVRQLNQILADTLLRGPIPLLKRIKRSKSWTSAVTKGQFLLGIHDAIDRLPARSQGVIEARMGIKSSVLSLADIGKQLSLTKEMVRLIEKDACARILDHRVFSMFFQKVDELFATSGGWVDFREIETLDDWFFGIQDNESVVDFILSRLSKSDKVHFVIKSKLFETHSKIAKSKGQERYYLSRLPAEDLLLISKECSLDFESAIKKNLLHDELQSAIRKRLPSGIPGAFDVLYEKCTKATRYANLKNEQHCQASNATDAAIIRILESAHAPMTWNQIEKLLEPEIIVSTSYFKARLSSLAIKFGRNSYGLMTHCPLPLDELNQIKVVIEEFIAPQSVERQWHSQDFLEVCEVKGIFFSIQLDIYLVNMALLSSSMLQPLGRLVWARKDAQGLSEKRRVGLQRAMVLLLEKSGGPLSTEEIKRQIKEIRGVGHFFQVFPVGRIVQVGKGMWDLNDRNDAIEPALT